MLTLNPNWFRSDILLAVAEMNFKFFEQIEETKIFESCRKL